MENTGSAIHQLEAGSGHVVMQTRACTRNIAGQLQTREAALEGQERFCLL